MGKGSTAFSSVGWMPWVAGMRMIDGRATAYQCQDFACAAPVTAPEELL